MSSVRSKETKLEVKLRAALWAAGLRGYRKNVRSLPGTPDVVFGPAKLAVFVHGCFWHMCPRCNRNLPKTNSDFWEKKLRGNHERDQRTLIQLVAMGFRVLTFWECDIRKRLDEVVSEIAEARLATLDDSRQGCPSGIMTRK